VQSIDPLLQLAASPEEMWNIVAEICLGRVGVDNPLKPPTSITPFKSLQGWISSLEFIWVNRLGQMQARRQKASKSTSRFLLQGFLTSCRLTRRDLIELVGEEVILQERERWFSEFKKLGKGKGKRPDGFTTYIRKLTRQLSSEKPVDKSKRTEKMWSWEKNNTSVKSYHQTLGIKGCTPNITYHSCT